MRSMMSLPRALSLRNPEAVIEPSGNATAAATESRSGSCSPTASRCFVQWNRKLRTHWRWSSLREWHSCFS